MTQTDQPIVVNSSATPATIQTTIGQFLPYISGFVASYFHIMQNDALALLTTLIGVGSAVWRIWSTRSNHAKLVTAAANAPNSVAQVK